MGISKLANIHYASALAQQQNIKVISVHPGTVRKKLSGPIVESSLILGTVFRSFNILVAVDAFKGALNQLWGMTNPEAYSGVFYYPIGVKGKESKLSQDKGLQEKLWEWTQGEMRSALVESTDKGFTSCDES
ncbi:hypothetical protein ACHAPO_010529 [Fusarium lateritium]